MSDYLNYINNETKICTYAFQNVDVNSNGDWHVCCKSPALYNKATHPTIEDFWNSEKMRNIRKSMLDGKEHPHCNHCWHNEHKGKISYRQHITSRTFGLVNEEQFKQIVSDTDIETGESPVSSVKGLEIRLSNLCNLKCRMCNPLYSSRWASDWKHLSKENQEMHTVSDKDVNWDSLSRHPLLMLETDYIKNIVSTVGPNLKKLTVPGGEPLLETRLYEVFDVLRPHAENISLVMITNATKIDRFNEIDQNWKSFFLVVSCDGTGDYYEYIRQLANWNEFSKNVYFLKTYQHISISFNVTVQIYNYPVLIDTITWMLDTFNDRFVWIELIFLDGPRCLSLRTLPKRIKDRLHKEWSDWTDLITGVNGIYSSRWEQDVRHNVAKQLRRVIELMMIDTHHLDLFVSYSDRLDEIQNVKVTWRELLPELAEELKDIKP